MLSILEKQAHYDAQMRVVRDIVHRLGAQKGWEPLNRGRRAHASIAGAVGRFTGVIDVTMADIAWDEAPAPLPNDYRFNLWSAGHGNDVGWSTRELFWSVRFDELERYVPRFVETAWSMLASFSDADFSTRAPAPAVAPDLPPTFGPPRNREPRNDKTQSS